MISKFQKLVLITVFTIFSTGCGEDSTAVSGTVTKKGLLYKIGTSNPYSGIVTGYAREGYRTRKMKYEKKYKNGIRQGDTKFWYPNGKIESIVPYANGKINGKLVRYYEKGGVKERIQMANGKRGSPKRKKVLK